MTDWNKVGAGSLRAAEQRFWLATGDNADAVITRILEAPSFVESLADFAVRGGPPPSMSVTRAREIMGANFFGVEEGMRYMNATFTSFERAGFAEVPATDEELEEMRDTHIVVAAPSISIIGMRERVKKQGVYRKDNTWHLEQAFAARLGVPRYHFIRKTHVANSTSKTWDEQQPLLSANEEVPSARVLCYAMGGIYCATGEKLFSDVWVRTSDVDSDGYHVSVRFLSGGVYVYYYWDSSRHGFLGLASARKSN